MKGCLKQFALHLPGVEAPLSPRKSVAFQNDSLEQIFLADEWDRTPTEPARNLSYQDLLELKEIQRTLPRANQPPDLMTGRSGSHYLAKVPIGLLPLLPDTPSGPPSPSSPRARPTSSPMSPSWASFRPNSQQCPLPSSPPLGGVDSVLHRSKLSQHPSNLSHLPQARAQAPKPQPRFAFLPLLDGSSPSRSRSPSPAPSDNDPPTPSLTNASLESSPLSRASSCSPEPPFMQLPPPRKVPSQYPSYGDEDMDYPAISSSLGNMRLSSNPYSPYGCAPDRPQLTRFVPPPPPPAPSAKPAKKKNVIYVNGMEIDLDDDDDDSSTPPATSPQLSMLPSSPIKAPSIPPPTSSSTPSPSRTGFNAFTSPPSSPTLRWQTPPSAEPSMGVHAPIRFKRQAPKMEGPNPISVSPPTRRGSICRPNSNNPRSSPVLMPRA